MRTPTLSRRRLLQGTGALVVTFSLPVILRAQSPAPSRARDQLDTWLAIGQDGRVTLSTGKVELGTGVETALSQIVAEELDVAVARVTVVQGDTALTPDQGPTVGSKTIQLGGPPIREAAAEARQTLLTLAAARLGVSVDMLAVADGVVSGGARRVTYAELVGGQRWNRAITKSAPPKRVAEYSVVGRPIARVDIPAKVAGSYVYVQNVRVPSMLHGRVVRTRAVGATVDSVDEDSVRAVPGLVKVVQRGNFVGVVAEREEQAVRAARELKVAWRSSDSLPDLAALYDVIRRTSASEKVLTSLGDVQAGLAGAATSLSASYQTPWQMHASIGPSCAVADVRPGAATVWSGTQHSFGLRAALGKLLGLPPADVRVVWVEASGCYGHNGADDVAGDAALLSQAVGKPVRVQWSRQDEHGWEPKGPAMVIDVRGGLDAAGRVTAWDYTVTTPTHSTRPQGEAGNLLAGREIGMSPRAGLIGGDRNAKHTYVFPTDRVVVRWQATSPLRPSALRGLGASQNSFANESFIDELAATAGADPVDFRLRHLSDARARAVIERVAALARWDRRPSPKASAARSGGDAAIGRGIAYAQYETETAYAASVVEVEVSRRTGEVRVRRVWVAHDCGLIVNPDGVRNQIEGATIQTISRAIKEAVAFDRAGVTSLDWTSYPILTFPEVPESIEIELIDRPDQPSVGAGEPAVCPIPGAVANAIFDATGARLRTMPFTPERVLAALR